MDIWGKIGMTAGEIYTAFVDSKKAVTVATVRKKVTNKYLTEMGIGWLAREGKLKVSKVGKNTLIKVVK